MSKIFVDACFRKETPYTPVWMMRQAGSNILAIHSLDQLKDKIAKVIVMVLIVSFFQKVLHTRYDGALEMLYFALSIGLLAVGLYFLGKVGKH